VTGTACTADGPGRERPFTRMPSVCSWHSTAVHHQQDEHRDDQQQAKERLEERDHEQLPLLAVLWSRRCGVAVGLFLFIQSRPATDAPRSGTTGTDATQARTGRALTRGVTGANRDSQPDMFWPEGLSWRRTTANSVNFLPLTGRAPAGPGHRCRTGPSTEGRGLRRVRTVAATTPPTGRRSAGRDFTIAWQGPSSGHPA
jgi:hypothetical protein